MGKHNASDTEWDAEPEAERTQVLPVLAEIRSEVERAWPAEPWSQDQTILLARTLDEPERARSKAPVRIAVLVAVVATVMLSALVWTVNRRSDPEITALRVDPPSASASSGGMLDTVVTPAGAAPTTSPMLSASAGASVAANPAVSATSGRRTATPTANPAGGNQPPTTPANRPPATSAAPPPPAAARLTAQYQRVGGNGFPYYSYTGKYTITNRGEAAASGWTLVVTFSGSGTLTMSTRSVRASSGPNHSVVFTSSGTVSPGGSASFTFDMQGSRGTAPTPTSCVINGSSC